jgi:hypothetical protein
MPKRKKETRRSRQSYPELDPRYNLKTRADLIDQDYLHKLSDKELQWLNKFNKEEISASFDTKNPNKNFNKSKKARKRCYDSNNARNRDILSKAKASNQLVEFDALIEKSNMGSYEDFLINKLDSQEAREAIEWLATESDKDEEFIEEKFIFEVNEE